MGLPNINIVIGNGNMGRIAPSDNGITGLALTRMAVPKRLGLNKVYVLSGTTGLKKLGIEQDISPLLRRGLIAFYVTVRKGVGLYLIVVSEATTLTQMCATTEDSPLKKLVGFAAGRIHLVGINRGPPAEYSPTIENSLGTDVQIAIQATQNVAESFLSQLAPFRLFLPAIDWNGNTSDLYQPRQGSYNRVAMVLASDREFGSSKLHSAAIGQALG